MSAYSNARPIRDMIGAQQKTGPAGNRTLTATTDKES